MERMYGAVKYWLVEHPSVRTFEWKNGETPAASLEFLTLTVTTYLTLTFLLVRLQSTTALLPSAVLRPISTLHNLTILLLSLLMTLGCTLSSLTHLPHLHHVFCFPTSVTPPPPRRGPIFFWAYVFYLSKILEFVDTLLIIVSGSSIRRLSFLHVYHHATVVVMCYLWLETAQSLFPVALVTNSTVHTIMYSYYLLCGLGIRPSWKRLVTDCQILQFVFSFLVSGVMLYYHFWKKMGCSGIWAWCFNALFNASLLYLFLDFHSKNYTKKMKMTTNQQLQWRPPKNGEEKQT
ncbi:hypothetical protein Dimus_014100 [Dionaea muscipula]